MLAALVLLQGGCGAIFLGSTQVITVHSIPPSSTVRILQTGFVSNTPAIVPIARDGNYVLVVEAPGYQSATVPLYRSLHLGVLVADIFLGLIGVFVDAVTGHWWVHHPRMIHVTLDEGGGPAAPRPGEGPLPPAQGPSPPGASNRGGKLRLVAKVEPGPEGALKVTMIESAPQMTVRVAKLP